MARLRVEQKNQTMMKHNEEHTHNVNEEEDKWRRIKKKEDAMSSPKKITRTRNIDRVAHKRIHKTQ